MRAAAAVTSAVLAAALGALCSYFQQLLIPLSVLVCVMLLDYGTGMAKAWVRRELSSRAGLRGILKKTGYAVIVAAAGVSDWLVAYGLAQAGIDAALPFLLAAMVTVWLIINELISLLENAAALGAPVPGFLTKLMARLKRTVEAAADAAADGSGRDGEEGGHDGGRDREEGGHDGGAAV